MLKNTYALLAILFCSTPLCAQEQKQQEEHVVVDAVQEGDDVDYAIMSSCATAEVENMYQLLDTVLACFEKIHELAQKNEDIPAELVAEVQKYTASEEVMDAVLLYAWQKGDVEVALTILSFIRAEAFVKGAQGRTRGWADDGFESDGSSGWSSEWDSDDDSDSGYDDIGGHVAPGVQKFIVATTILTAGFIAVSSYYGWFQQPATGLPGVD